MHNATTKQRHAALRRKLGVFLGGAPRWVREKRARLAELRDALIQRAISPTAAPGPAPATDAGLSVRPPEIDRDERDVLAAIPTHQTLAPFDAHEPSVHDAPRGARWLVPGAIAAAVALLAFATLRDHRPPPKLVAARPVSAAEPSPPAQAAPPAPTSRPKGTTAVVRGDTLWHLAARHLGDPERWPALWEANRAAVRDPDLIFPGQELKLPPR
ncbi:MAG TPA: LysM peptidoglycan-binding domain-containing protein [Anaeromyxobacter sp.]|nr:LysM peptidoglycan-binding domain-containing protein [Anaeromyxobacter sp.]